MLIAAQLKRKMSYLTMSEQKARRKRQLKRCALLSLGIIGLALLLLPFHDPYRAQQPYPHIYKNRDG